jgi:hypothetical protein
MTAYYINNFTLAYYINNSDYIDKFVPLESHRQPLIIELADFCCMGHLLTNSVLDDVESACC